LNSQIVISNCTLPRRQAPNDCLRRFAADGLVGYFGRGQMQECFNSTGVFAAQKTWARSE
jgi:hypothetical protein